MDESGLGLFVIENWVEAETIEEITEMQNTNCIEN